MGVLSGCKPRKEVLKGDLDDAIFAANFGELVSGKAPAVYGNAKTFFQNTHPASQLRKVVEAVCGRLANAKEGGATIRLSTGFGGGKTHTLMALWHLAKNIHNPAIGTDLLAAAGRPKKITVAGLDASEAGVPTFARHGKIIVRSLWGELAYLLGGDKGWKSLGDADNPEHQPDLRLLETLFPSGPVLILFDELVIYMATLSERGQGNLLSFLNKLLSVVGKRPQTALLVTDPAGQVAYTKHSVKIGEALEAASVKLDEIFGRKMTDFDPIGDESARVIIRRLFESVDQVAAQSASAAYHALYERVSSEEPGLIPPRAASADYARRIVECYPFNPRLLDTAQERLGALQDFQKSRGVLRLFARILRTVWESKNDVDLISAGDIEWSNSRIQADLLQRLNRDNFKAAVSADIGKHAVELDSGAPRGIHVRVASALMFESIPMQPGSGFDPSELTQAVLRPDEAGPEPREALDRLVGVCWHTYPVPGGRGWQFRYEPNIIKQIEERMGDVPLEDAKSRVLSEAQGYFSGPAFKVAAWPTSARQVPESADLQLVLCEDKKIAKAVCTYTDDSDPRAPIPRRFLNSILAITATMSAFHSALDRAQRLLATEAIEREHKTGDSSKLVREQLQRIKPELQKQFRIQTRRAFDRVVLAGGITYSIDEEFQVPEEQMLQKPQGQSCLRRFLDSKGLIYQAGDALDVGRFMNDVLPGATPLPEKAKVYTTRAIHERFLGAPKLRLLPDGSIVRQTIMKAVQKGKIVVRLSDDRAYDAQGCVEGSAGRRRRGAGSLASLALDDSAYVTEAHSDYGILWVKEDTEEYERERRSTLPPPPDRVTTRTWEEIKEYSAERPLVQLHLVAAAPADSATLTSLSQPFGANIISLSVTVSGTLKDGGSINFAASNLKPNHPAKPLAIAQTLYNAMGEGATYEADLALGFGPEGRSGLGEQLRSLAEKAPGGVVPKATFEKPMKGAR